MRAWSAIVSSSVPTHGWRSGPLEHGPHTRPSRSRLSPNCPRRCCPECCEIRCGCRRSEQPTVHTLAERDPDRVFSEHPDASWRDFPGARSSTPFHQKVDNGGCARRRPDREPGRPREAHREGVLSARFAATDGETATAWRRNAWGTSGGTVVPKKGQSQNTRPRGTSNPGSGPHEPVSTLFTCRSCSTASWNCSHLPCPVPAPYWWTAPWDWEATPRHSSRPAPNCV